MSDTHGSGFSHFDDVGINPPGGSKGKANGQAHQRERLLLLPHEFSIPERPKLVAGFLGHGMEALVYGSYEAGKTFFCVDLGGCVAAGQPWRGRSVQQGIVAYLAGERHRSVQGRCLAWMMRNGLWPPNPAKPLPFAALRCGINLFNGDRDLENLAEDLEELRQRLGLPVRAIIPDTVHSLSPGSDESNQAFGILTSNTRRLRDKIAAGQPEPPATIYTHHSGQNEANGPRGGTALPAAMDMMLRISADTKYRTIKCEKASDFDKHGLELEPFVIDSVTLRHDEDGQPVQFGVAVAAPPDEAEKYTRDTRAEALRLLAQGASQSEVARRLGIAQSTVSRWATAKGGKP
jgi:hypothetical protein